jgi:hypothetical protein
VLLKISDRLAQAFGINLSRLLPGFVRLFCCVPRASWLSAPLGFRFISLIYFLPATIYDAGRHLERPRILVDISNGGAKIAGVRAHTIPDEFRLRMPLGDRRSCRVRMRATITATILVSVE